MTLCINILAYGLSQVSKLQYEELQHFEHSVVSPERFPITGSNPIEK